MELDHFPRVEEKDNKTGCCPRFRSEKWNGKRFDVKDLLFAKTKSRNLFHVPVGVEKLMTESTEKIKKSDAWPDNEYLILSRDISPFSSEYYFRVTHDVEGMESVSLSGTFVSRVFEGDYSKMGSWMKQMNSHLEKEGEKAKEIYAYYTTCPRCAKEYGKNYVVLLAKV